MIARSKCLSCFLVVASLGACTADESAPVEPAPASRSLALSSMVLFDNGDPSEGFGVTILSERDSFNQVGDDFTLASDSILTEVEWWGVDEGNDFALRIFEIIGGVPQDVPIADIDLGVVVGVPQMFGFSEHLFYSAPLPSIELAAGDYVLSIVEKTAGNDWFWSASCEDGCEDDSFRRADDTDSWDIGNWDFAFRLLGTEDDDKVEICHCPGWWRHHCRTLKLDRCAATAHLKWHLHDTLGACTPAGRPAACY